MTTRIPAGRSSPVDRLANLLADPSKRISALIMLAYSSGIGGLAVSLLGDAGNPTGPWSAIGVGLMGISFVCLFVVCAVIVDLGYNTPK